MTTQELIAKTHAHGVKIKEEIKRLSGLSKALEALNARRRKELKPPPSKFAMYDSVDITQIPGNAVAVAGYTSGKWPTYKALVQRFPRAKHLSIAINAGEDADCLDIETGDASPVEAPAWVKRQKARGVVRPCVYANKSTMPAVLSAISKAGIKRSDIRVWVADWTGEPHIPAGAEACQWTDHALGRNLDQSLCIGTFL